VTNQVRCPAMSLFPWDTGGMYDVDLYARVRRAVLVEGKSRRAAAREFGLARSNRPALHNDRQLSRSRSFHGTAPTYSTAHHMKIVSRCREQAK
jgi:hypothetical protein